MDVSPLSGDHDHKFVDPPEGVDVTGDYGTPSLLFIYYNQPVSDKHRKEVHELRHDLETWNAFELGRAESQVNSLMQEGKLPTDDYNESRIRRTEYRSKVIQYLRKEQEPWLVEADKKEFTVELKTDEKHMNKKVEQELRGRLESKENLPAQFGVVLRIINRIIAARKRDDVQQYHFTNVEVSADGRDDPEIKSTMFRVYEEEGEGEGESVKVKIDYVNHRCQLNRERWAKERHNVEDFVKEGERIRGAMTLNFCVDA
ncbi:hypothetical protein AbraIFM66950_007123 [Aspergillus brasiliensis]|nr:hypothetical protein AbraIFM66950_007123 [Aspergillus brasiliensis]